MISCNTNCREQRNRNKKKRESCGKGKRSKAIIIIPSEQQKKRENLNRFVWVVWAVKRYALLHKKTNKMDLDQRRSAFPGFDIKEDCEMCGKRFDTQTERRRVFFFPLA